MAKRQRVYQRGKEYKVIGAGKRQRRVVFRGWLRMEHFETRDIGHVLDDLMLVLKRGLDVTNLARERIEPAAAN